MKKGILRTPSGDIKVDVRKQLKTKAIVEWKDELNNIHTETLKYCNNIGYITEYFWGGICKILFILK